MNRAELQAISKLRTREAKTLLDAGNFEGSYYLMGYAVECALKSAIAKKTKRHDFPDKSAAQASHTHNLEELLRQGGLNTRLTADASSMPQLTVNWAVVKDWRETARYQSAIGQPKATDLYKACMSRKYGVLTWIKKYW